MAIVTSASNAAISHTGKSDRTITGVAALVGGGSELVADRRIGLAQIVGQPQEVGNFSTTFCSWDDGALTSLIAERTSDIQRGKATISHPPRSGIGQARAVGRV